VRFTMAAVRAASPDSRRGTVAGAAGGDGRLAHPPGELQFQGARERSHHAVRFHAGDAKRARGARAVDAGGDRGAQSRGAATVAARRPGARPTARLRRRAYCRPAGAGEQGAVNPASGRIGRRRRPAATRRRLLARRSASVRSGGGDQPLRSDPYVPRRHNQSAALVAVCRLAEARPAGGRPAPGSSLLLIW